MEHDDSDIHGQNFHLTGEDKTIFPRSLQPFCLSKFVIDDQVHSHPIYGNIIGPDIFLVEQSQPNNWTEGLSAESMEEFGPSAPDSCSRSRTNDVWSEATSSESVEMLLKSVGESEIAPALDGTTESKVAEKLNVAEAKTDSLTGKDDMSARQTCDAPCHGELNEKSERGIVLSSESVAPRQTHVDTPHRFVEAKACNETSSGISFGRPTFAPNFLSDAPMSVENTSTSSNDTSKGLVHYFHTFHDKSHIEKLERPIHHENYGSLGEGTVQIDDSIVHGDKDSELLAMHFDDHDMDSGKLCDQLLSEPKPESHQVGASGKWGLQHDTHLGRPDDMVPVNYRQPVNHCSNLSTLSSVGTNLDSEKLPIKSNNDSLLTEVSDGLLEAIAYPVKTLKKDTFGCDKVGLYYGAYTPSNFRVPETPVQAEESNKNVSNVSAFVEHVKDDLIQDYTGSLNDQPLITNPLDESTKSVEEVTVEAETLLEDTKSEGPIGNGNIPPTAECGVPPENVLADNKDVNEMSLNSLDETGMNVECAKDGVNDDIKASYQLEQAVCSQKDDFMMEDSYPQLQSNTGSVQSGDVQSLSVDPQDQQLISPDISVSKKEDLVSPVRVSAVSAMSTDDREESNCPLAKDQSTDVNCSTNPLTSESKKISVSDVIMGDASVPVNEVSNGTSIPSPLVLQRTVILASPALDTSNAMTTDESNVAVVDASNAVHVLTADKFVDSAQAGSPVALSSAESPVAEQVVGNADSFTMSSSPAVISCNEPQRLKSNNPQEGSANSHQKSSGDGIFSFKVVEPVNSTENTPEWKSIPSDKSSENLLAPGEDIQHGTTSTLENASVIQFSGMANQKEKKNKKDRRGRSELKLSLSGTGRKLETRIDPTSWNSPSQVVNTSTLPDLNASASGAVAHQTFTDSQHVQLRAQIFVYGSLIQGTPPLETYMASAFGGSDGGKAVWVSVWRASVERYQNLVSPLGATLTPASSRLGTWSKDIAIKDIPVMKSLTPTQSSGKFLSAAHSKVPLQSQMIETPPLASAAPPLTNTHFSFGPSASPFTQHSSQKKQRTVNVAPWVPSSPHPSPWIVSPKNLILDSSAQKVPLTAIEPSEAITPRNVPIAQIPNVPPVATETLLPNRSPVNVTSTAVMQEQEQKTTRTPKNKSTPQNARKRKSVSTNAEQQSASKVLHHNSDPAAVALGGNQPTILFSSAHLKGNAGCIGQALTIPQIGSSIGQSSVSKCAEQPFVIPDGIYGGVEQSKLEAKIAVSHSDDAVSHCQSVWNTLSTYRSNTESRREVEDKLTSAAAAAAAAASVAKAASEAAKVASEAALQAKLMAEEAMTSQTPSYGHCFSGQVSNSEVDKTSGSCSVISEAREVARKRAEEASAAAKRAQNLDAILKAAELAAEAVAQAGSIIAMGDPLPFSVSQLLEFGPNGFWKPQNTGMGVPADKCEPGSAKDYATALRKVNEEPPCEVVPSVGQHSGECADDAPNTSSEPEGGAVQGISSENCIQIGSMVEVLADEVNSGRSWYSARVIDVNDNKAFVCYNEPFPSRERQEWVPLGYEDNRPPRIRLPHPLTSENLLGIRKRRRDVFTNGAWAPEDHVDAWIEDSWREGVITEGYYTGDDSKFIVTFLDGKSSHVTARSLRPSLVWKDNRWSEWTRSRPHQGDSPFEKRRKLGSLELDGSKPPIDLSAKKMVFAHGTTTTEGRKNDALKTKRAGLLKEGSKVVYGVPKSGKMRKFLDVTKDCVPEQGGAATTAKGTSFKFSNYLMTHSSTSRESNLKVDAKAAHTSDTNPRILKSTKSRDIPTRGAVKKGISRNLLEADRHIHNTSTSSSDESNLERAYGTSQKNLPKKIGQDAGMRRKPASNLDNSQRNEPQRSDLSTRNDQNAAEPRRSNRRIQPTSRLLESLQSSLSMPTRVPQRGTSTARGKAVTGKAPPR